MLSAFSASNRRLCIYMRAQKELPRQALTLALSRISWASVKV